jgi:hypothetical protein
MGANPQSQQAMETTKHLTPETLSFTLLEERQFTPAPLLQLQIGGYLQYLDEEHIALKPICRLLGWDYKDVVQYLRTDAQAPRHKLFTYGRFVYQSTWGVAIPDLVTWLQRELKNLDHHDCTYALLLCVQMLTNTPVYATASKLHALAFAIIGLAEDMDTEFSKQVFAYLAATTPEAYNVAKKQYIVETLREVFSEAT